VKFLIDEDVAIDIARFLRHAGHHVDEVSQVLGTETPDPAIWQRAIETGAIVITCNRDDFLRLAGQNPATGLIILNRRRTRQSEFISPPCSLALEKQVWRTTSISLNRSRKDRAKTHRRPQLPGARLDQARAVFKGGVGKRREEIGLGNAPWKRHMSSRQRHEWTQIDTIIPSKRMRFSLNDSGSTAKQMALDMRVYSCPFWVDEDA
jgi:predicted nuclease of predicted toxin-antitoxin system